MRIVEKLTSVGASAAEQWRPVPGFVGYFASNLGRIVGLHGTVLRTSLDKDGYPRIGVSMPSRKRSTKHVHTLVALAWSPQRMPGEQVNHKDRVKHNSNASNLEWLTQIENIRHAMQTGLHKNHAPSHSNFKYSARKLSEGDVRRILLGGEHGESLAMELGVDVSCINNVRRGKTYGNVCPDLPRRKPFGRSGSSHPRAKLTEDDIRKIRSLRGLLSQKAIGEMFDIPQPTVSAIQLGKIWGAVK